MRSLKKAKSLSFVEFNGEYIQGTGRFKGIKGSYKCKGRWITPYTLDKTICQDFNML